MEPFTDIRASRNISTFVDWDFSAIRTSCRLRGIKFQIVLGNCKKCFTDFHDKCSTLMPRPYIYKTPVFTVNGNLHQMNVEAIDKATFPIFQYFRSTCDYIDKSLSSSEEANVAVISRQGRSRSVAIVLAYLMFKRNLTLREAVRQIKQKRAIRLNLGFLIQLVQFDRKVHRERKKPVTVRMKNVFEIRKKDSSESFWFRENKQLRNLQNLMYFGRQIFTSRSETWLKYQRISPFSAFCTRSSFLYRY
ncbi:dual specificity phosphatase DUPD1 [Trichonephila clavata]|uniref:Dual specificity phosphatase DUPD1 n=1 Tax=Trichonephila clavata TaxID=2740835 RepID=A0A8X6J5G1_TRICU|nr:dual specificity phosphatase DUPD1 [Trichonephila clavata]